MLGKIFSCCAAQTEANQIDLSRPEEQKAPAPLNPWEQPDSKVDANQIDFDMVGGGESDFLKLNMKLQQNKTTCEDVIEVNHPLQQHYLDQDQPSEFMIGTFSPQSYTSVQKKSIDKSERQGKGMLNDSNASGLCGVSITEKKLNSYLNQANFIIHKNGQKNENSSTGVGGISSSFGTRDHIHNTTNSQREEGECSSKAGKSGNSSVAGISNGTHKEVQQQRKKLANAAPKGVAKANTEKKKLDSTKKTKAVPPSGKKAKQTPELNTQDFHSFSDLSKSKMVEYSQRLSLQGNQLEHQSDPQCSFLDSQENKDVLDFDGEEQVDLGAVASLRKRGASKTQSQGNSEQFRFSAQKQGKRAAPGGQGVQMKNQARTSMQVAQHKKSYSNLPQGEAKSEKKQEAYQKALEEVRNSSMSGAESSFSHFNTSNVLQTRIQEENEDEDNSGRKKSLIRGAAAMDEGSQIAPSQSSAFQFQPKFFKPNK